MNHQANKFSLALLLATALISSVFTHDSAAAVVSLNTANDGGTINPATDKVLAIRSNGVDPVKVAVGTAATQPSTAFLQTTNNLSDLGSTSAARTNLGLGTAATQAIAAFLQPSNNLSDVANATTALTNILPSQAGNSGKVLGTNGTTQSWVSASGTGTVTSASVVTANGFSGTVANATTTPAITLGTSVTGLVKGNGTGLSAAVSGTDYQAPITLTTTGSSGPATLSGATLNVPQYSGGGSGTVTSISAGFGMGTAAGTCGSGTITTSGTISSCTASSTKTADYSIQNADGGNIIAMNSSSPHTFTLPQASPTGNFSAGWCVNLINLGTGVATITPTVSTVTGAPTTLGQTGWASICSDGTNYTGQGSAGGTSLATSVGNGLSISSGILGVNSPLSVALGGTGLAGGTSGGIPAYTASGTLASSGVLTANAPVIGGGAGAAPTVGSRSGNTTTFVTATGTLTTGHCVSIDGSGNFVDAGGACTTGGGGGTVASSTIGQVAVYTGSTTVTGAAGINYLTGALTLGQNTTQAGSIVLNGSTSGTATIKTAAAAGTGTIFQVPADNGTNGYVLQTNGSGVTTWVAPSGGGGSAMVVQPASVYTTDTAGNLFPYVYSGAGGNASSHDTGWGVAASLAASPVLEMRFQMPSVLPSGTFKLVSYCLANASSGVAKYTISDANVAAGSSPSAASLTGETQTSITWSAADQYVVTKTALSSTPTTDGVSVIAVTFNATGWTLASIMSCRWVELWE